MAKKAEQKTWMTIEDLPDYEIALDGEIRKKSTGKSLKQIISSYGFLSVRIWEDSRARTLYVHRELARAFIPNTDNKKYVMHRNENKMDNSLENLFWASRSDVSKKSYKTLVARGKKITPPRRPNSAISVEQEAVIIERLKKGETGATLALEYNTSEMSISRIRKKLKLITQQQDITK